jgi:hypothetical protein
MFDSVRANANDQLEVFWTANDPQTGAPTDKLICEISAATTTFHNVGCPVSEIAGQVGVLKIRLVAGARINGSLSAWVDNLQFALSVPSGGGV